MPEPQLAPAKKPAGTFAQWYGVLAGAIAWAMQLQANYALVRAACSTGDLRWLYFSSAAFLLLALSGVLVAWLDYSKTTSRSGLDDAGMRGSFMGMLGLLTSSLFALIIIGQAIPVFIFGPCEQ
jgi:hypothetical protein